MLKRSIFALILVSASTSAFALHHPRTPGKAPEIDASLAIGGITLLTGSLAVLRARRSR